MSPEQSLLVLRKGLTRRQFIYTTALAAGATALVGCSSARLRRISANEKMNIAGIGCGGKGTSDIQFCASENIVALCDVDEAVAAEMRAKFPKAAFYRDYREMLEKEKLIDAVTVSTPDHTHAAIAAMAMRMGKHVYCQKPLTYSVYEARVLRQLARKHRVVTQMGNQGSAEDGLRRAVEIVQAGIIGPVREVHVWTNRPVWPQGMGRPPGSDPVPGSLAWDLWLGPAPVRPYKAGAYHQFNWRGWQDFGTGALGDMACHTANMPFRALKLGYPSVVEAESSSEMNRESYPLKSRIRFEFPSREGLPPVKFWWYDGGDPVTETERRRHHDGNNKPPEAATREIAQLLDRVPPSGCLLIGDKGKLFSPDDYGARFYLKLEGDSEMRSGSNHEAVQAVPEIIARNPFEGSADERQHLEWIAACKGGRPGYSNFDVAAYLTEIILLGCVALRVGEKLEWDGPNMRAINTTRAGQFLKRDYRQGWEL